MMVCCHCGKPRQRQVDCSSPLNSGAPAVNAATVTQPSFQSDAQTYTPASVTVYNKDDQRHYMSRVHRNSTARIDTSNTWSFAQRVDFFDRNQCQDCGSDISTNLLLDGAAITHVSPPWFVPETPIQSLERDSWLRHVCAANSQSLNGRGNKDFFWN